MRSRFLFLAVALVVCACAGDGPAGEVRTTSTVLSGSTVSTTTTLSTTTISTSPPTATTEAVTTTAARQTTTSAVPGVPIVLRGDGLGPLDFGTPTATVMEALVEWLGPPSPGDEYPYGGHPLRHVYWDDLGLSLIFSDYEFYRDDGLEHLAGWGHGPKPTGEPASSGASWTLKTAEGMGIGSTLEELQATYGDRLVLEAAPCDGPPTLAYLTAVASDDRGFRLFFYFDRETSDPAAQVTALEAGAGPGC